MACTGGEERADGPGREKKPRKVCRVKPEPVEDPVFKASEVMFFAPDCGESTGVAAAKKPSGKILRTGYILSARPFEKDGRRLVEFVCMPTADSRPLRPFMFVAEAGCMDVLTQRRPAEEVFSAEETEEKGETEMTKTKTKKAAGRTTARAARAKSPSVSKKSARR